MQLTLEPGVSLGPGRATALIAPPGFLVDLLMQPEVGRYSTLYLYGVSSRVLFRLPRRGPNLGVQSCMTVHQLLSSLREAYQTIVVVEYDGDIFSALEGDDRDVITVVGEALQDLARSSVVLLYAPRADRGLRSLLRAAGQVVWRYDDRPAAPALRARAVQRTLGEAGWGASS
ncbi:MAG TPA: hypothetical protein PK089_06075 [Methanoregulaceae archaeon]|nr:hypothetical protein [Methanoregulaceae archaeon]